MDGDFVLDGEIVALDEQGRPSFQLLQNGRTRPIFAYFYVFDLLIRDGELLHIQTIERRRERLSELLPESIDQNGGSSYGAGTSSHRPASPPNNLAVSADLVVQFDELSEWLRIFNDQKQRFCRH